MPDIDLSQLPAPNVVEALDYEDVLAEIMADFRARYPQFDAFVESDPALKLLEVASYRETLLRWRINEAAKAVMLAFARGSDLEHLVALTDVARRDGESDELLLRRFRLSLEALSVAGPRGTYEFHALSADPRVKSVRITTPTPGAVNLVVLGGDNDDGLPDAALIATVTDALSDVTVRPLTDTVTVSAGRNIVYQVVVAITVGTGPDRTIVQAAAEAAILKYLLSRHEVGAVVYKSAIFAAAHVAGVIDATVEFRFDGAAEYDADEIDFAASALAIPTTWQGTAAPWPAKPASIDGALRFTGYTRDDDGTDPGDVQISTSRLVISYLASEKAAIDAAFVGHGATVRVVKDASNYSHATISSTAPIPTPGSLVINTSTIVTVGTISDGDAVTLEVIPREIVNATLDITGYRSPAAAPADGLAVTVSVA